MPLLILASLHSSSCFIPDLFSLPSPPHFASQGLDSGNPEGRTFLQPRGGMSQALGHAHPAFRASFPTLVATVNRDQTLVRCPEQPKLQHVATLVPGRSIRSIPGSGGRARDLERNDAHSFRSYRPLHDCTLRQKVAHAQVEDDISFEAFQGLLLTCVGTIDFC